MLIDVDSSIPNLALMKISAYLKQLGYETGFNISIYARLKTRYSDLDKWF